VVGGWWWRASLDKYKSIFKSRKAFYSPVFEIIIIIKRIFQTLKLHACTCLLSSIDKIRVDKCIGMLSCPMNTKLSK
jgi:hypothetical protein